MTIIQGSNGNLPDFLANVSDCSSDIWIQHFFVHFNLIFPVLSRPYFEHQLKQDQLSLLVKYAVYAIGCRYADNTNSTDRLLFEHCESLLNLSQDPPTLATAQVKLKKNIDLFLFFVTSMVYKRVYTCFLDIQ